MRMIITVNYSKLEDEYVSQLLEYFIKAKPIDIYGKKSELDLVEHELSKFPIVSVIIHNHSAEYITEWCNKIHSRIDIQIQLVLILHDNRVGQRRERTIDPKEYPILYLREFARTTKYIKQSVSIYTSHIMSYLHAYIPTNNDKEFIHLNALLELNNQASERIKDFVSTATKDLYTEYSIELSYFVYKIGEIYAGDTVKIDALDFENSLSNMDKYCKIKKIDNKEKIPVKIDIKDTEILLAVCGRMPKYACIGYYCRPSDIMKIIYDNIEIEFDNESDKKYIIDILNRYLDINNLRMSINVAILSNDPIYVSYAGKNVKLRRYKYGVYIKNIKFDLIDKSIGYDINKEGILLEEDIKNILNNMKSKGLMDMYNFSLKRRST